jgi:hypothetical protein
MQNDNRIAAIVPNHRQLSNRVGTRQALAATDTLQLTKLAQVNLATSLSDSPYKTMEGVAA